MAGQPTKSAADYIAMAVCPALIMLLVGSLVFFLLQISYSGAQLGRLHWTLFWFVFAMVLVSRIAIEQSSGAAFLYGLALAGATSLLLIQYVGFIWQVWLLLGLIWWAANKITWDCTLIDDDVDASGQGLLRAARFGDWTQRQLIKVRAVPYPGSEISGERAEGPIAVPGTRLLAGQRVPGTQVRGFQRRPWIPRAKLRDPRSDRPFTKESETQAPHSPGVWVLYFSLAAVPVFGAGELLLRRSDTSGRLICFEWLLVYLGAALALLLLSSFLGLRRYLRQRRLQMPGAMAASWIGRGVALLSGILLLAIMLPRPSTPYSLAEWFPKIGSPPSTSRSNLQQSRNGQSPEQAPAKANGSAATDQQGGDNQAPPPGKNGGGAGGKAGPGRRGGEASPAKALTLGTPQSQRWLSYAIAIGVGVVLLIGFRRQIGAGIRGIVEGWAALWKRWFGRQKQQARPFRQQPSSSKEAFSALLSNPFASGKAEQMPIAELIRYSFEGIKLWAAARGFSWNESLTPIESTEMLAESEPAVGREVLLLGSYYSQVAYSEQPPAEDCRIVLKRLWTVMGS